MPILNGVTRNSTGAALAGVNIKVFRSDTDALVASGTSTSDGSYSIPTPGTGPYYAVAYKAGSPDIAGTTVNTLMAEAMYTAAAAISAGLSSLSGVGAQIAGSSSVGGAAGLSAGSGVGEGVASGATMPSGAIGAWYMDQVQTSPRIYVPNAVTTAAAPNYLNWQPRLAMNDMMQFGSGYTWTGGQTDSSGGTDAFRFVGTGNFDNFSNSNDQPTLPAGTYTWVIKCKSNTGTSQQFKFGRAFGTLDIYTATTSWQRFAFTATTSGQNAMQLQSFDGATGVDLLIESMEVFAGASDPGSVPMAGHMVFGRAVGNAGVPTIANGEVDFTGTNTAFAFFDAVQPVNGFTAHLVVRRTTTPGVNAQSAVLGNYLKGNGYGDLMASVDYFRDTGFFYNSSFTPSGRQSQPATPFTNAPLADMTGKGGFVVSLRHDLTSASIWFNGYQVYGSADTRSALNIMRALQFNNPDAGLYASAIELYGRALTDAEIASSATRLIARQTNLTFDTTSNLVLSEGDSNTDGSAFAGGSAGSYPFMFKPNAAQLYHGVLFGRNGSRLDDVIARQPHTVRTISTAVAAGKRVVISLLIGTNDGSLSFTRSAAAQTAAIQGLTDAWRAAGAKVIYITLQNRTDANAVAGFDTWRQTINADMIASVGTHIDAVVDTTGDANIGQSASPDNTTYFSDKVHFTAAGQALLETYLRPVINGFLS